MSQVFIAYKRDAPEKAFDSARADAVRAKLEDLGVQVFFDLKISQTADHDNFSKALEKQLASAAAILVLWTEASIESDFVIAEAHKGRDREVLVQAMFGNIAQRLRVPFNIRQTPDLAGWIESGASQTHPGWQRLLEMLGPKLQRPGLSKLAEALQNGTDDAKRAFIRAFPEDPFVARIVEDIIAIERKAFEGRIGTVQNRLTRRHREAEKKLKGCRDDFEKQILELRAGRPFTPPDPLALLDDNTKALQQQVDSYKELSEKHEARAAQAEESAASATSEIASLNAEIETLKARDTTADDRSVESMVRSLQQIDALRKQVAEQNSTIATKAAEITDLQAAMSTSKAVLAERDHAIEQLGREHATRRVGLAGLASLLSWPSLAASAAALLLGGALGASVIGNATNGRPAAEQLNKNEQDLRARLDALALRERAVTTKEGEVTQKEKELASKTAAIASREQSLAAREADLSQKDKDLSTRTAGIIQREQTVLTRESDILQKEKDVNTRAASVTRREQAATAKEAELSQKERDLAARMVAVADREKKVQAAEEAVAKATEAAKYKEKLAAEVAKCDDLASFRFDPDRPTNSKWQETHTKIGTDAFAACDGALRLALQLPSNTENDKLVRRLTMQFGRAHAGRAFTEVMSGNRNSANASFDAAVVLWKKAAKMNSGQAYNMLGVFYAGSFAISEAKPDRYDPPQTPALELAWPNYDQAARLKNPTGLANAGLILTGVDTRQWSVTRDERKGREYLEEALKLDIPAAYYGIGVAMVAGIANYPKNASTKDEGVRLLGIAACKGVAGAADWFKDNPKYTKPVCSE